MFKQEWKKNTTSNFAKESFGYEFTRAEDMALLAMEKGNSLVKKAACLEAELTKWAQGAQEEVGKLLKAYGKLKPSQIKGPDRRVWEIAHWETEISRSAKNFFNGFSQLMEDLKKLNPPLSTRQTDGFLREILDARRRAMIALQPMTNLIAALNELKGRFAIEPSAYPIYHPPK